MRVENKEEVINRAEAFLLTLLARISSHSSRDDGIPRNSERISYPALTPRAEQKEQRTPHTLSRWATTLSIVRVGVNMSRGGVEKQTLGYMSHIRP